MVFDDGMKKMCRHNQYFGVKAAQDRVAKREGGIIWHTQGSGKSLTMVWLAKWIREHQKDARVLLITDRTDLDEQIEGVFNGVSEEIYRTTSGADLIATLNRSEPWLICSLIHKFRGSEDEDSRDEAEAEFIAELHAEVPADFRAKGNLFVFVDEAHRTQSGKMHAAMKRAAAGGDVHRLHRHAAAEAGQGNEHRDLRLVHPHLQVRRGRRRRRRARPALRGADHRPGPHLAGEDRRLVRRQDQGHDRPVEGRAEEALGHDAEGRQLRAARSPDRRRHPPRHGDGSRG